MTFDWTYFALVDGRLVDNESGYEGNINWPSFDNDEQAEQWLRDNDIRGNIC